MSAAPRPHSSSAAPRFGRLVLARTVLVALLAGLGAPHALAAQARGLVEAQPEVSSAQAFGDLTFRQVGPFRGGRSTAAAGFLNDGDRWVMGTTGGGIWLSHDNGTNWTNVSDGFFGGSIGAVTVAPSDPNVIYVGEGSHDIRGNTSHGRGVWKSLDGGETWRHIGLPEAGQIARIEVHPRDHDLVYVAALGHAFGKNVERGIFRSSNGGESWEHVLALSDSTGASALSMDPNNPRVLYAGMWRGERKPWTLISGGEEGGVYKSVDGGDSWVKLGGGLPEGLVGKVGISVSPAQPGRVWAIVEAEPAGGVYRSDDGGRSWTRTNSENRLRQRAWYYTHVRADPRDPNTVYVLNTGLYRSVDAGVTWQNIEVPHGDVHDLWIHPADTDRMVVANDGGAQVSVNGGRSWSTYFNQPTAEFYDVVVDNQFPYRLYAAQQDNTTISVPAWQDVNTLYPKQHWLNVGGCETGPVALHPDHPDVIYAGCYGGVMDRYDLAKGQRRNMQLYPQLQLGMAAKDLRHRFQWVSPMLVSRFDRNTIYHGSQFVNRSRDEGMTWETISPDLTTNTPEHQEQSGGPINADVTGVEIFNTVFSLAESPFDADEIWAGSDDGRLHVTRDAGADWTEVTPPELPEFATIDEIELSTHDRQRAWIAAHRYRLDDFTPYLFRTDDGGRSWQRVTQGIPSDFPVRTVREDPVRSGLVFAGTEYGLFVSFDAGASWESLQQNLPRTPITGMRLAHDDLILSTQGRSFWILDDMTPLREVDDARLAGVHLFKPRDTHRLTNVGAASMAEFTPEPLPTGAQIHFWIDEARAGETLEVQVVDVTGRQVQLFTTDSTAANEADGELITPKPGLNRVAWRPFYPGPDLPEGAVVWGYTGGVVAPPGTYTVRMALGDEQRESTFELLPDPRIPEVTQGSYETQFEIAMQVRDSINAIARTIESLDAIREQVRGVMTKAEETGQAEGLEALADTLTTKAQSVTEALQQTRNQSGQDPIRFDPRLDNQWLELYGRITGTDGYISGGADGAPQQGTLERLEVLLDDWNVVRSLYIDLLENELRRFNEAVEQLGLPAVTMPVRVRMIS